MGELLLLLGFLGLAGVLVSLGLELRAWMRLDEPTREQQRAIKRADRALHNAERQHKAGVAAAERAVREAERPAPQRKFGQLELLEDRVRTGRQEYPLTPKTKPKVIGRGRGEERSIMVILEDVNWPHSLSATKLGKQFEFEAQRFASDVRVFAPRASEARALQSAAIADARRAAAAAADQAPLQALRAERDALGERLKAAGPPPGKRWRGKATAGAAVTFLVGAALLPPADEGSKAVATGPQTSSAPTRPVETTPTPTRDERLKDAQRRIAAGDYRGAQAVVASLSAADRREVRRLASERVAQVAERALQRGDRSAALKALRKGDGLPHTDPMQTAWDHYRAAVAVASAERRASEAATQAEPETDADADVYTGQTCEQIGHSFQVTPGSDPDHDRDGDGLACESQ